MYKLLRDSKPADNQVCIIKCPRYSKEGYAIAKWDGSVFIYENHISSGFNNCVDSWLGLNVDGIPVEANAIPVPPVKQENPAANKPETV